MPKGPEARLKAEVDELFKQLVVRTKGKFWYVKTHGAEKQRGGLPDYLVCAFGKFGGLELKGGPNEQPTERQRITLELIKQAGGIVAVACTMKQVKLFLARCFEDERS